MKHLSSMLLVAVLVLGGLALTPTAQAHTSTATLAIIPVIWYDDSTGKTHLELNFDCLIYSENFVPSSCAPDAMSAHIRGVGNSTDSVGDYFTIFSDAILSPYHINFTLPDAHYRGIHIIANVQYAGDLTGHSHTSSLFLPPSMILDGTGRTTIYDGEVATPAEDGTPTSQKEVYDYVNTSQEEQNVTLRALINATSVSQDDLNATYELATHQTQAQEAMPYLAILGVAITFLVLSGFTRAPFLALFGFVACLGGFFLALSNPAEGGSFNLYMRAMFGTFALVCMGATVAIYRNT